jgi:hypothetical protein
MKGGWPRPNIFRAALCPVASPFVCALDDGQQVAFDFIGGQSGVGNISPNSPSTADNLAPHA